METISSMHRIIRYTENKRKPFDKDFLASEESDTFLADALCFQATRLAKQCVVHVTTTPPKLHGRMNTVRVSYVE